MLQLQCPPCSWHYRHHSKFTVDSYRTHWQWHWVFPVSAEQCGTLQPLSFRHVGSRTVPGLSQFLPDAFPYNCVLNTSNRRLLAHTAHHYVIRPTTVTHHKAVLEHISSVQRNVGSRRTKVTWVRSELGKRVLRLRQGGWNIHKFYVLPTQCIYVFCVDLRTNSDYFLIQH